MEQNKTRYLVCGGFDNTAEPLQLVDGKKKAKQVIRQTTSYEWFAVYRVNLDGTLSEIELPEK